jgi:Acetyltransferase (GNAT) family.
MRYVVAEEHDLEAMYNLGKDMHEESEFAGLDWDPEKVRSWIHRNIHDTNRFVLCAYDDNKLCGIFIAGISTFYFGNSTISSDYIWYVDKDYRGTRVGIRLLKRYVEWAKSREVDRIQVGVSSGMTVDRTGELLVRMGFEKIGGIYKVDS